MADTPLILVADIGGTHCRMALVHSGQDLRPEGLQVCPTAALGGDVTVAMAAFHRDQGAPPLAAVSVCAAGPLQRGEDTCVKLTNIDLIVSAASIAAALGIRKALLVNDFSAIAACAPLLQPHDLRWHANTSPPSSLSPVCAVMGAGTGLGVSAWLGGDKVLEGEGGHVALAPADAREREMLARMGDVEGFVSAEDFLSGPGFVRAYAALRALDGLQCDDASAADVYRRVGMGDALAIETVDRFTAALGRVAGDLALTLGASSVILAGGIVPGWGQGFDALAFRHAFEAKGAYRRYLSCIPSATVTHPQPALLGLSALAGAGAPT